MVLMDDLHHTVEEVRQAASDLSQEDLVKLEASARLHCKGGPFMRPKELIGAAVVSACKGGVNDRRWKKGVPFIRFLAGIIRSISGDETRLKHYAASVSLDEALEVEQVGAVNGDGDSELLNELLKGFESEEDEAAACYIRQTINGCSRLEILELCGLDAREGDAAKRRVIRKGQAMLVRGSEQ